MQTITTIGFEIAKSVFQVHGVDVGAQFIIRRQMKRWSVRVLSDVEAQKLRIGKIHHDQLARSSAHELLDTDEAN